MTEYVWKITDHVCGACLSRIVERKPKDGPRVFRCSNCGVEGEGRQGLSHPPICACASKIGKRDAGIRCVRNDRQRPEMPGEIVAKEIA